MWPIWGSNLQAVYLRSDALSTAPWEQAFFDLSTKMAKCFISAMKREMMPFISRTTSKDLD